MLITTVILKQNKYTDSGYLLGNFNDVWAHSHVFPPTLKCLSIGTPKIINFPFVSIGKLMVFRCPNIQAHCNEAVLCIKFGTLENNEFSIWDKWKIYYFLVSQYLSTLGYSQRGLTLVTYCLLPPNKETLQLEPTLKVKICSNESDSFLQLTAIEKAEL